jgi:hypothetical protein
MEFSSHQAAKQWILDHCPQLDVPVETKAICAQIVKRGDVFVITADIFSETILEPTCSQVVTRYHPVEEAWKYPFKLLHPATEWDLLPTTLGYAPVHGLHEAKSETVATLSKKYSACHIYSRLLPSLDNGHCMTHIVLSDCVPPCEFMLDNQLVRIRPAYPRLVEFLRVVVQ